MTGARHDVREVEPLPTLHRPSSYCWICQLLDKHAPPDFALRHGTTFTFSAFRWAMATVSARQNNVPAEDGSPALALVPLFDLCNHDARLRRQDGSLAEYAGARPRRFLVPPLQPR